MRIDIFEVEDLAETRFYAVHMIDAVSRFQMGEILIDKSADSVVQFCGAAMNFEGDHSCDRQEPVSCWA